MSERRVREVWAHNGTTWVKEDEISILEAKLDAMEKRCIMEVELRIEQVTALEARLAAAERFIKAHDVVEAGVTSYDLHNAAVEELSAARSAVDWISLPAAQEEQGA